MVFSFIAGCEGQLRPLNNGGRADGRTGGRADGRTGGRANGRTGGRADGRTGGRADGRMGVGIDRDDGHWTIDEAVGIPVQTSTGPKSKAWHAERVETDQGREGGRDTD